MIKVYFIRHGETAGNQVKRYTGRSDESLSEQGIIQAKRLAKHLLEPMDQVFVSPMKRCQETAAILFPNIQPTIVPDLREINFGVFEGKTADELQSLTAYQTWLDSNGLGEIPEGESLLSFQKRCSRAFDQVILSVPDYSTVAFVVHGGTIMALFDKFVLPKQSYFAYQINNCEYYLCDYEANHLTIRDQFTW